MKRQLSSIDLNYLVQEFKQLEGSRIDKIYQPEKNIILISFFKSNEGKKLLEINIGKSIHFVESKDEGQTQGFGMLLRKYLDGLFLEKIHQLQPERIIKFSFSSKENKKDLYIEFFGKGNAILCDSSHVIINSLEHHEFKDRVVRPKEKYKFPSMTYNLFEISKNGLKQAFIDSKKDSVVTCLATELGLGGLYSEEACILSGIDKTERPKDLTEKEIGDIIDALHKLTTSKISAVVYLDNENVADFAPFRLGTYKSYGVKEFSSFSEAADFFFSKFKEVKESEYDKNIKGFLRIIGEQKLKIEEMQKEESELRQKAELIYHKYQEIKVIIDELNKASRKHSWRDIKEKLKGHSKIKELNEKDRKVVIEF